MKRTTIFLTATAFLASAACNAEKGSSSTSTSTAEVKAVKPPASGDWSEIVSATPDGGFLMGNPTASVKLIEYGSMTCPHCREFDEKGVQPLIDKYVKTGKVSFEFRNYVRDPYDLTGSLVIRCNGAKSFFPLMRALYKDQPEWIGKLQAVPPEQQEALGNLGPDKQFLEIAKLAGFQEWAAMRGVPTTKSGACLTDEAEVNRLVQMNSELTTQYPDFQGTPTFIVNGELVKGATWEILEAVLRKAIG